MAQTTPSTTTDAKTLPALISPECLATLRAHGVVEAYLFGSVSRGEERPDSDVDLLVAFDHNASFGERFLLAEALGHLCGRPVDLLTNVHPAFAPYILPTLVPLLRFPACGDHIHSGKIAVARQRGNEFPRSFRREAG